MKNLIIVLVLAAAVGLGAYSLHQQRELDRIRASLAETQDQLKAAQDQLNDKIAADDKISYAEKKAKLFQDTLVETSAMAAKQSKEVLQLQESLAAAKTNGGTGNTLSALFKDPAMKEMIVAQQKAFMGPMIDKTYASLFQQLNLTPEQKAYVKDLLQKKMMVGAEMGMSMLDSDLDPTKRAELSKQIKTQTEAYDEQIKQFLGDENFKAYQDYEKGKTDRMAVSQFRDQLAGSGTPLTAAQEQQLAQVMQEERTAFKWTTDYQKVGENPGDANFKEIFTEERLNKFAEEQAQLNQKQLARAKTILSPEQYKAYETHLESQLQMQKSAMMLAGKMFGVKKP